MDQYSNLIKAVTSLLLLFFVAYVYNSCKEKPKALPISQQTIIQNEIFKTDSVIIRIPFTYSDSQRTSFLLKYQSFR
jgi:hypothetical protein